MTTCDLTGCPKPADIKVGDTLAVCAGHWTATYGAGR